MRSKKTQSLIQLALLLGIIIAVNVMGSLFYSKIDLTEDKRFSLTQPTKELVKKLGDSNERVFVEVYLEGDLPAGIKRLKVSVEDLLSELKSISPNIDYSFVDPNEGSPEQVNKMREGLKEMGILPTNLIVESNTENKEMLVFPAATIRYKGQTQAINLLENNQAGVNQEVIINNSITFLEYKFANALKKAKNPLRDKVMFVTGHGELSILETADLRRALYAYYDIYFVDLDTVVNVSPEIDVMVVAKPQTEFSEKEKFTIDQYVMNGGKMLWMVDALAVTLDSLRGKEAYVPYNYKLNLDDQLFKFGARINPNIVLDIESSNIPQVIGMMGDKPQIRNFPWWYHPAVAPSTSHPIVKGLDRIDFQFASSIDTVKTKTNVQKTVLLQTSPATRLQFAPVRISTEILRYKPDPSKFNKPPQPLAVLLEGTFPSNFENRVSPTMLEGLNRLNIQPKYKSEPTKMIVISDGDIGKNRLTNNRGQLSPMPLGYNEYGFLDIPRYTFANKDFLLNCFEYLLDEEGLIAARNKEIKLRLLDAKKTQSEKTKWQMINIALPVVLLVIFGVLYGFIRRRRFA